LLQVSVDPALNFSLYLKNSLLIHLAEGVNDREQQDPDTLPPLAINLPLEPSTIDKARRSPEWPKWEEACQKELGTMASLETYSIVSLPPNRHVIKCRWVYKHITEAFGYVVQGKLV
jgi:hypothetical protein